MICFLSTSIYKYYRLWEQTEVRSEVRFSAKGRAAALRLKGKFFKKCQARPLAEPHRIKRKKGVWGGFSAPNFGLTAS